MKVIIIYHGKSIILSTNLIALKEGKNNNNYSTKSITGINRKQRLKLKINSIGTKIFKKPTYIFNEM